MGAFSGLKDAKRGFGSNKLKEGKYVVRIDACDFFEGDQVGEAWKNTLTILAVEEGPAEGAQHKVGEVVHTFFYMKSGKKTFHQNLKGFMAGVLNVDDEDVGEEEAEAATKEDSPMKGLVTVVTGRRRTSKKTKDEKTGEPVEYVVYSWSPCLDASEVLAAIGEEAYAKFFPNG